MSLFLELKQSIKNPPDNSTASTRSSVRETVGTLAGTWLGSPPHCSGGRKPPQSYLTKNTTLEVPQIT